MKHNMVISQSKTEGGKTVMISILIYTVIVVFSCGIISLMYYNKAASINWGDSNPGTTKISITAIVFIALLFTVYNIYVTNVSVSMGGDRTNYYMAFSGLRKSSSLGLEFVFDVVRILSGNITTVFYITTFVCVALTLLAYRLSDEATPATMLLLFLSEFIFSTFVNLKQCYTSAFAALFFVIAIQDKGRKSKYLCISLIILACLFHPVGFVLIPLYFIIKKSSGKLFKLIVYVMLLIVILFFEKIMGSLSILLTPVFPSLN